MDFEQRLKKAIERGQHTRDAEGRAEAERQMSLNDLKNLHSKCRLELSEHIERCLRDLSDHFPGFKFATILDDKGWGATVSRDDIGFSKSRQRDNFFSRFQIIVPPFSDTHIISLAAKGTVRNKEIFNRNHFHFLNQVDLDSLNEMIDLWVLEFAEQYSARS